MLEKTLLRYTIKKSRKKIKKMKLKVEPMLKDIKRLTEKQQKELDSLKTEMALAIFGSGKRIGLNSIFEVEDENGKELTVEKFMELSIEEQIETFEELINQLEKEV